MHAVVGVGMESLNFSDRIKIYLSNQFNLPEEQVVSMLPEFKKTLSGHMMNIEKVFQTSDLSNLEKAAHTIKGAFLNLGLIDCAEIAMKIESSAAEKDPSVDYSSLIISMGKIVKEIVSE